MIVLFVLIGLILGFINYTIICKNVYFENPNAQVAISKWLVVLVTLSVTLIVTIIYTSSLEMVFYVLFWNLLLVTAWIDLYTSTINVFLIYAVTAINSVLLLVQNLNIWQHVLGGIIGFAIYFLIYLASKAYYKREAFGYGDVI